MITLHLVQAKVKAWSGYTANRTGFLPARMSWFEPEVARALEAMQQEAEWLFEFTDGFRSAEYQLEAIRSASKKKRRLYAPPTKSGHNFGWSVDVSVDNTLANLLKSSKPELQVAGQSRDSMARFMSRFGFSGIRGERWHFNHLRGYKSTAKRIEAIHSSKFVYDDQDLQRMLNAWMSSTLSIDGDIGPKTRAVVKKAQRKLSIVKGVEVTGNPDAWTRRLLAGMTMKVEKAA
jgi:hypothetical protein